MSTLKLRRDIDRLREQWSASMDEFTSATLAIDRLLGGPNDVPKRSSPSSPARACTPSGPVNVLVMHWYDRGYSFNDDFDRALQAALQPAAPEGVEYYSEYLETNRFPGDDQVYQAHK